jgi:hypothetical protein
MLVGWMRGHNELVLLHREGESLRKQMALARRPAGEVAVVIPGFRRQTECEPCMCQERKHTYIHPFELGNKQYTIQENRWIEYA